LADFTVSSCPRTLYPTRIGDLLPGCSFVGADPAIGEKFQSHPPDTVIPRNSPDDREAEP